jgi:hypothetical protein
MRERLAMEVERLGKKNRNCPKSPTTKKIKG